MLRAAIEGRARILRETRRYFDDLGFVETDTPCRIAAPAPEPHIDCPPVATGGWLRASPELQMKMLLASGLERIYQIGPCFRDGERGSCHNTEFTMLEWYRLGASSGDIEKDATGLVQTLAGLFGREEAFSPVRRISVREAYRRFAAWDPWTDWDGDRFDLDMALKIEPAIAGMGGMVFLHGYPPAAASLAKIDSDTADRWELYACGMELANCFGELCDTGEQTKRFEEAKETRKTLGEADYPLDGDFLRAVGTIPSAAGVALGVDRLVMALLCLDAISAARYV